ncbi:MAG: HD domain-containing protein [Treponema sp.]|jgi:poly(A) polymerase|nr:HD domain-containing protein [Treponema sp.]
MQGYSLRLRAFSAIDRYLRRPSLPFQWLISDADIAALARLFEHLRFPGAAFADAALDAEGQTFYFRCIDAGAYEAPSYPLLSFSQDMNTKCFHDPSDLYPRLRTLRDSAGSARSADDACLASDLLSPNPAADATRALMDAALALTRYSGKNAAPPLKPIISAALKLSAGMPPCIEEQRTLLISLLLSPRPDLGLDLLNTGGFITKHWPELATLNNVDHSKEFHPEGNGWRHTLETFRYRKTLDLRLSLALLLHDAGKAFAVASGTHRFEGHAELGVRTVRAFLRRLDFAPSLIDDVCFLVRHHMMPAALKRLPLTRIEDVLESPLFPTLLELYRCDEASSFKGLDGYYDASAAYQAYLKQRRNPYR